LAVVAENRQVAGLVFSGCILGFAKLIADGFSDLSLAVFAPINRALNDFERRK